jgi:hypothetical protein
MAWNVAQLSSARFRAPPLPFSRGRTAQISLRFQHRPPIPTTVLMRAFFMRRARARVRHHLFRPRLAQQQLQGMGGEASGAASRMVPALAP